MSTGPITLQAGIHKISEYSTNPSTKNIQAANAIIQHNNHEIKQATDKQLRSVVSSEQAGYKKIRNNNESRKNPRERQGNNKGSSKNKGDSIIDIQI